MKVYIPNPCSAPSHINGGNLQKGWQDVETSYAKQLLKAGQALDQKAYDALAKQNAAMEKSEKEWREKQRQIRIKDHNPSTAKKKAAPKKESPSSSSKYENTSKVG